LVLWGTGVAAEPLTIPLPLPQRVMNSYNWDEYTFESVRFSPQGDTVAVATDDGVLYLFDSRTGQKRWQLNLGEGVRLRGLVFAPDGQTLYTGEQSLAAQVQAIGKDGKRRWQYSARPDLRGTIGKGTFAGINRDLRVDRAGNLYVMTYWNVFGEAIARVQVVSLNPQGRVRWRFPPQPLVSAVGGGVTVSPDGTRVGLVTGDFVTDFTRANRGLTTTLLDSRTGQVLDQKLLAPIGGKPLSPVCPPAFSSDNQTLMTLAGNGQAVVYRLESKGVLVPSWQQRFSREQRNTTVYYKFLESLPDRRWLVFAGTTAPLPGATDEDPKQEHPASNMVLLVGEQGKILQRWRIPSLDRPPTLDAKTLLLPLAQNTITAKLRGLALLELGSGRLSQPLTVPGAIIAAHQSGSRWAALEVPLLLPGRKRVGVHRLHLGP